MPVGGGNPKNLGDGMVVKLRPEYSRGNTDIWDTRDAIVALMDEFDRIYAALATSATYGDLQTALAGGRTYIKLLDSKDGQV